jgi:NADH-quinone oxidoreductase subunit J
MDISIASMLFYIFSGLLCISALQVILAKNPVHAVLFLILCFAASSALFIIQGAEFLGLMLILVYVGAVMVLFLFVVMMLDIKHMLAIKRTALQYMFLLFTIGGILIAQIIYILFKSNLATPSHLSSLHNVNVLSSNIESGINYTNQISNTKALGKLIFTEYLFAFEIVGFILLVAIIIAVTLTLRTRKDNKAIDVSSQININAKDRVILVDSKISKISKISNTPNITTSH